MLDVRGTSFQRKRFNRTTEGDESYRNFISKRGFKKIRTTRLKEEEREFFGESRRISLEEL